MSNIMTSVSSHRVVLRGVNSMQQQAGICLFFSAIKFFHIWCLVSMKNQTWNGKSCGQWVAHIRIAKEKESAPAEVRDITHLYCSDKTCTGQKCPCVMAELSCIDICSCTVECQNPNKPKKTCSYWERVCLTPFSITCQVTRTELVLLHLLQPFLRVKCTTKNQKVNLCLVWYFNTEDGH